MLFQAKNQKPAAVKDNKQVTQEAKGLPQKGFVSYFPTKFEEHSQNESSCFLEWRQFGKNAGLPILDEEASVVVVRKMNMEWNIRKVMKKKFK